MFSLCLCGFSVSVTSHTPESRILSRIDDSKLAIVSTIICCLPLCVNPVIDWLAVYPDFCSKSVYIQLRLTGLRKLVAHEQESFHRTLC